MEFDKTRVYPPRPYEVKARDYVNQTQIDDKRLGLVYDELQEHLLYRGYASGYIQAIRDVTKLLKEKGKDINIEDALLYGIY